MPNWCFTRYVIQSSDPKDIEALKAKLDELNQMPEPLLPNGFGNLWLGNIVHLLGGDWRKVYCRGRILDYELSDGNLHLSVESAWNEMYEVRELLLTKHPELDIFYMSEEGGMGIFITNDSDGRFFPERYILDTESDGPEYFEDLSEVAVYVSGMTGKDVEDSEESIRAAIDEWEKEDPDNRWAAFNVFDIV